jgi:hypothetical protein
VARDGTVRGLAGSDRAATSAPWRATSRRSALDARTLDFYREMAARVILIALEKGGLTPERAAEIVKLLHEGS